MRFNSFGTLAGLGLAMLSGVASEPVLWCYAQYSDKIDTSIDYSRCTNVLVAFGIPKPDATIKIEAEDKLQDFVKTVQDQGPKVSVSLGGWTGSGNFSTLIKNEENREKFIDRIVDLIKSKNLDGIDLDWEYPGRDGNCNVFDKDNDTKNYLEFLRLLRKTLTEKFPDSSKLVTMAVWVQPFDGPDGPTSDMSEFANLTDFAFLMQYDYTTSSAEHSGPNSPLDFEEGKGTRSFRTAIKAWTDAKWPRDQLVAGFAFYGRSSKLDIEGDEVPTSQYQKQSKTEFPKGDEEDEVEEDACTGTKRFSGAWRWKHLLHDGVLKDPLTANEPWVRQFDNITKTPWLFNKETKVFITYDDPESIKEKARVVNEEGLAGGMMWSIDMDKDNVLTDAMKENLKGSSKN
ncbi:hypothetical protein L249_4772 [Ophiocordyceps polyrhachis-furcata BCC 54312]|uniref:chitinase n=1 Tax=Ophiocordyceps polyrhachis-furcata BCC 54312 TaxID=1330021 RepID=A0A367L2D6_9HYPO|nr:hypothetical protein L249_4772 [Ophiocordyceps polyrhachis-furcata BCC 54312]